MDERKVLFLEDDWGYAQILGKEICEARPDTILHIVPDPQCAETRIMEEGYGLVILGSYDDIESIIGLFESVINKSPETKICALVGPDTCKDLVERLRAIDVVLVERPYRPSEMQQFVRDCSHNPKDV